MKDFERFKKKVLREHLVKSILVGVGVGLLMSALAIVLSFLTNPAAAVWVSVITGVLFAGASGYYYWYKTKPSDKKIALRLDKKLGLHEKCATMIEFKDKEDALIDKQREDTTSKLAEKPTKALKFSVGVWVVPALAVASAFFTASFFTPKNVNSENDISVVNSSEDPTDSIVHSIHDEASSVIDNNSDINSAFASIVHSILDQVENSLSGNTNTSERSSIVHDAQSLIDSFLDDINSKEEIGKALKTEPDQHLKDQGQDLIDGDIQGLRQDFQDMFDDLSQLEGQDFRDYAGELADQIDDALEKAKLAGVSEDDDLYQTYKQLANWLRGIEEMPTDPQPDSGSEQTNYDSKAHEAAESAIAQAASNAASNVNQQNENSAMASAIKSMMESMINPQTSETNSTDSGDDSNVHETIIKTEGTEGTDSNGPHETTTQGPVPSGSIVDTSVPGDDPQPGPTPEPGSEPGSGPGAGPGQPNSGPHTDIIYTGSDVVEYGSVIDSYGGAYVDDRKQGDQDDDDTADDYFQNLYGDGNDDGQGGGK